MTTGSRKAASKKSSTRKKAPSKASPAKKRTAKTGPNAKAAKKTVAKKVAAKKSVAKSVASARSGKAAKRKAVRPGVSVEQRWRMIAEAAYLRAEKRGFIPGGDLEDWLVAEKEVDAQLVPSG